MAERLVFMDLTGPEIDALDREKTVFVLTLSPLEVHGPHLPMGTDVWVAEEVRDRALTKAARRNPDLGFVVLPSFCVGSDTIPGSVEVDSRAVNLLLRGIAGFLARRGFRYLLVVDNHGGPRHQIATAKAVRRLYRERGFHIVAPFLSFYRRMVELDPDLLSRLGAGPGACGDAQDCHAGLNETSLMLRAHPEKVRASWKELARVSINPRRWPGILLGFVGRLARELGGEEVGKDLSYIGLMLCWVTESRPSNYIGEPRAASPEAGERMLDAFSDEVVARLEAALRGEPPYHTPLGWTLRLLEPSR
ncbi:creatininase family protein [Candidatus Solincola tengchongensis]|uniref:creatininase family protein n=1 Tax=Candidatus Solincola tengchongensis TaxID=2900693 RepID=UPI0025796001|nr:creatininase family protein [Candidatus Solincola tengchongensis]